MRGQPSPLRVTHYTEVPVAGMTPEVAIGDESRRDDRRFTTADGGPEERFQGTGTISQTGENVVSSEPKTEPPVERLRAPLQRRSDGGFTTCICWCGSRA